VESHIVHQRSPMFAQLTSIWPYMPLIALGTLILGTLAGFPLLALLPLGVYAAKLAIDNAERPATAFALWAFALGCAICFGTELLYIRDVFSSRLNTVFKFYYQAWVIWGLLAGYALWWLFAGRPTSDDRRVTGDGKSTSIVNNLPSAVVAALFCALLAGALFYPGVVIDYALRDGQRLGLDEPTPRESTPDGAAAIDWLRTKAAGDTVVLEAIGGSYNGDGFGGVSASTGLATVLGWPGHEDQWRGGDAAARAEIAPRQADVTAIYSSTNTAEAAELLKKYGVDYIFVGPLERATYAPEGISKLPQLGDVAFEQGDVTIYRVKP
jgi:uncharacterized membrane protein